MGDAEGAAHGYIVAEFVGSSFLLKVLVCSSMGSIFDSDIPLIEQQYQAP